MTVIRVNCSECGEVALTPAEITLWVCERPKIASHYDFQCPDCHVVNHKLADERIIGLLVSGGIKPRPWVIPAEAGEVHSGLPLTYDDLIDLHDELGAM